MPSHYRPLPATSGRLSVFQCALLCALAATSATAAAHDTSSVNVGTVNAQSRKKAEALLKATSTKLTKRKIFKSTQTERVIGKRQIAANGPVAGAAQALS